LFCGRPVDVVHRTRSLSGAARRGCNQKLASSDKDYERTAATAVAAAVFINKKLRL